MVNFAIYFPQFYPTDVNNEVWGANFTDWALVAHANATKVWDRRAPRQGFYDGSCERVFSEQVEIAARAGISGFGIYHYFFDWKI